MKKILVAAAVMACFGTAGAAEDITVDVAVIGAGGAGLSAAVQAHELGANVVVVEKMAMVGGNTVRAAGGLNAVGTALQQAKGTKDSVEIMFYDTMKGGHWLNDPALVRTLVTKSASSVYWLLAHGGDEKHIPINWDELERSGFSYTALGHIHKPQAVRRNRIVYAGALEPVDRNDTGPHGYVKGELTGKGNRISWIPCASREYIHLEVLVDERDTAGSVKQKIRKLTNEYGNENIYKIKLKGERDRDILLDSLNPDDLGNILEVTDETRPAYDFDRLYRENADNLIGRYIESFAGCSRDSEAYQALCEGVDALLANRR